MVLLSSNSGTSQPFGQIAINRRSGDRVWGANAGSWIPSMPFSDRRDLRLSALADTARQKRYLAKLVERAGIRETPEVVARLFERYQSIEGIFCALIDSLADEEPTTNRQAIGKPDLAHLLVSLAKAAYEAPKISEALFSYLVQTLGNRQDEALVALFLDLDSNCIDAQILAHGGDREVSIGTRRLLRAAIQCKATSIALAHNHPGGNLTPSAADYISTAAAEKAAAAVGIDLIDHFIVAGDLIFSIRHSCQVRGK